MKITKTQFAVVLIAILHSVIGCEHTSDYGVSDEIPKIIAINAPEIVELPKTIFLSCEVENTESVDLHYKWEATSGNLLNQDSSVVGFHTPPVESEVVITCTISDLTRTFDQKSVNISIFLPAFIGKYALERINACDSIYEAQNNPSPDLLFDIHEALITLWGFAYSWKVSNSPGLPAPDSCIYPTLHSTHMGILWKYGADEDSILAMARPFGTGYITLIFNWSKKSDKLILERQNETYEFKSRD